MIPAMIPEGLASLHAGLRRARPDLSTAEAWGLLAMHAIRETLRRDPNLSGQLRDAVLNGGCHD